MSSGDSDQQNFDLVVAVLPRVEELLKEEIKRLKKKSWMRKKDWSDYVGKIRPSVETFQNHVASVKDDASLSSPLLTNGIAQCLESMFSASILQDGPRQDPYPRLHAFAAAAKKEPNAWAPQNLFLAFSNPDYWDALLKNLDLVVTWIESNTNVTPSNLPASPSPTASTGDHEEAWKFSELLFRAVHCSCAEEGPAKVERESMLGLEMWKASTPAIVRKSSLLVKEKGEWHKLLIMGASAERSVRFAGCGSIQGPTSPVPPLEECLCKQLRKNMMPQKLQQTLRLRPPSLQFSNEKIEPRDGTLADRISLRDLISNRPADWKTVSRLALAFILASSLCYLYGGTWTRGGWSPAHIFLHKEGPLVHLCAFLEAQLLLRRQSGISGGGARAGFNLYPDIRQLGLVLLEIHLGELLETYLPKQFPESPPRVLNQEDIYLGALNVLQSESASFSSDSYWRAIDTCLRFANVAGLRANDKEVRQVLFQKIVEPLGTELKCLPFFRKTLLWSVNIDDEIALSNQLAVRMSSAFAVSKNGQRRHQDGGIARTGPAWAGSPPAAAAQAENPPMADSRTASQKGSDQWIENFKFLWMQSFGEEQVRRVKVAILDSGIDMKHPDFADNSTRRRIVEEPLSWVDKQPEADSYGHGTHIAGTMLSLVPNIDLCIGKITKNGTFEDAIAIVKGLETARENWRVDMISLSFTFEGDDQTIGTIVKEIDLCHKAGIPVFAAASNDGGTAPRGFPARHKNVFCIHAGSHEGEPANFNPSPLDDEDNFLVLGCDVYSAWQGRNPDGSARREYKTGTSFAVPVAVCIAAFMVAFIHNLDPNCDEWHIKPKSADGLAIIFKEMAVKSRNSKYKWISPSEYIGEVEEKQIILNIKEKLNYTRKAWR